MSIVQAIKDFMSTYPELKGGYFRVDFLGNKPTEYVIETLPCNPIIENYVGGSSYRQYLFGFGSREYYTVSSLQNIENTEFYEKLSKWVEEQNDKENLPVLGDGLDADELKIVTTGYMFSGDGKTARYQIQFILKYYKEA